MSGTVSDSTGAVLGVTVTIAATTHERLKMLLGTKSAGREWISKRSPKIDLLRCLTWKTAFAFS